MQATEASSMVASSAPSKRNRARVEKTRQGVATLIMKVVTKLPSNGSLARAQP
jgi:hypothetical protein